MRAGENSGDGGNEVTHYNKMKGSGGVSRKKEQYYREHREEYRELLKASLQAETKKEMKRINKQIRERFGRGMEIPVEERFPRDYMWMCYMSLVLSVLSLLISVARFILMAKMG